MRLGWEVSSQSQNVIMNICGLWCISYPILLYVIIVFFIFSFLSFMHVCFVYLLVKMFMAKSVSTLPFPQLKKSRRDGSLLRSFITVLPSQSSVTLIPSLEDFQVSLVPPWTIMCLSCLALVGSGGRLCCSSCYIHKEFFKEKIMHSLLLKK